MSGAFHIRMVAGIFMVLSGLVIVPQAMFYFAYGELENPINFVGALVIVALAVWLWRGSRAASYLVSVLSILLVGSWIFALPSFLESGALMTGFAAVMFVALGYCWWAVTFSKVVRAELAKRREADKTGDREDGKGLQRTRATMPD
jgi:hypothetical protein